VSTLSDVANNCLQINALFGSECVNANNSGLDISCNGFRFSTVYDGDIRYDCFKLRKHIYVDELSWVEGDESAETDRFDIFSTHFSIANRGGELVGTIRSISPDFDWMATNCYGNVFKEQVEPYKVQGCIELSRLCIQKKYRDYFISDQLTAFDFILLGLMFHSVNKGIDKLVFVSISSLVSYLNRRGYVSKALSSPVRMPDGCEISAGYLDVTESINSFAYNFDPYHLGNLLSVKWLFRKL
jgi:N-acyl-L-homoserine lactone synthetase